ncbi:MAG: polyribonucleotide nucleotidyltransferase [Candidatus Bipolaricaulota bacterium]
MELAGKTLRLESGRMAKQADGAVLVSWGDTRVLVTAVCEPSDGTLDYFPLRVDFEEKFYAGGKIPGGFFKREGKPSDEAVLAARFIDRPIRPLFPKGYKDEVHIVATVLSAERDNPPEIAAMLGASAALMISPAPFRGPIAGVHVGMEDGEIRTNPANAVREEGPMDIVVAGTGSTVTMVEGAMREVPEEKVIEAVQQAHELIRSLVEFQEQFASAHQVAKREAPEEPEVPQDILEEVRRLMWDRFAELKQAPNKRARQEAEDGLLEEALQQLVGDELDETAAAERQTAVRTAFEGLLKQYSRDSILNKAERLDGRRPEQMRPISIETGILPRVHGSALFTRGETQSLGTCTLGATRRDAQIVDLMMDEGLKRFMLHYNFPPFCVGEARRMGPPPRRAIGHGRLAENAVRAVLPPEDEFPYIIRVVSEILESNGSSSMASVCSGSLAMMDAGVPLRKAVAGVAMGLITGEEGQLVVLTDITGQEDHFGDMDFKVAGTRDGVTAFQLDVKTGGIDGELMRKAITQAQKARLQILELMEQALPSPRPHLSPYAPMLDMVRINPEKIGMVIGPGGKMIRSLQEETGTDIDIEDDGLIKIVGESAEDVAQARRAIEGLTEEIEEGKSFEAKVVRVVPFGAFVELKPGMDGLIHISNLSDGYVEKVEDVVNVGDEVKVEVIGTDDSGKPRLRLLRETPELKAGDVIPGKVTHTTDYGVFVEIAPGVRGLVHVSRLGEKADPRRLAKKGDPMTVEIEDIEQVGNQTRYKLRRLPSENKESQEQEDA